MSDRHDDYREAFKAINVMLTLWALICWAVYG